MTDLGLDPALVEIGADCWVWRGPRSLQGYGRTYVGGRQAQAHRVVWEHLHGPIPPGLFVCHCCDNPPCVRPDHLWLGTPRQNSLDAKAKGRLGAPDVPSPHRRAWHGRKHDAERDAAIVREVYRTRNMAAVARDFGLTRERVRQIRDRAAQGRLA